MPFALAVFLIIALWIGALYAIRKSSLSRRGVLIDLAFGVVFLVALWIEGSVQRGIIGALAIVPVLLIFRAVRSLHIRQVEETEDRLLGQDRRRR